MKLIYYFLLFYPRQELFKTRLVKLAHELKSFVFYAPYLSLLAPLFF